MRTRLVALLLALTAALAVIAPRIFVRNDAKWTKVEIARVERIGEEVIVVVRARNVNTEKRKVWIRGLDVSESLLEGGAEVTLNGRAPEPLPMARARRFVVKQELGARESADWILRLRNVAGARRGHVDVVLDGSSWLRADVSLD